MSETISSYDKALEELEYFIIANIYKKNSKLPAERKLCQELGISRTTLRAAINELVLRGLIVKKASSGTYVAPAKIKRNMLGVDSLSTAMREGGGIFKTIIIDQSVIQCNKQISRNLHITLGKKVYCTTRLRYIDGTPCIIETTYLDAEKCPDFDKFNLEKTSMYSIFKNIYNKKIVSGKEKISVTYLTKEEAKMFDTEENSPAFFAVGTTELDNHERLEYYKLILKYDMFKFTIKTSGEQ